MIQSIHAILRNALEHAVREELITRNVAKLVKVPAPKYKTGKALTVDQARQLLKYAREYRLYGVFALALLLGLRRAELLGLRWQDITLTQCTDPRHGDTCVSCKGTAYVGGRLTVDRTLQRVDGALQLAPTKSEDSDRVLPLPLPAVAVLLDQRTRLAADRSRAGDAWQERDFVFPSRIGTPLEPDNLRRAWYPIRAKLGLQMRFHDLRHTCVSLLLDLGIPPHIVREIAGHADVDITLRIYGHGAKTEHAKALGKLGDLLF